MFWFCSKIVCYLNKNRQKTSNGSDEYPLRRYIFPTRLKKILQSRGYYFEPLEKRDIIPYNQIFTDICVVLNAIIILVSALLTRKYRFNKCFLFSYANLICQHFQIVIRAMIPK